MFRWSVRMFRREWRQQVLIMSLLAVAAAAAVGLGILAHNLTAVSAGAQFGTANHFIQVDATGDGEFTISGEPTDGGRSEAAVPTSPLPGTGSGRSTSSGNASSLSRDGSNPSNTGSRTRAAPTAGR